MKTNKLVICLGFLPLLLAGCSTSSGGTPSSLSDQSTTPIAESSSKQPYIIIDDVPEVSSGKYIVGRVVYDIDKTNKKLTAIDYDSDYDKYIANQGTTVFEKTIQFIKYGDYNAIFFQHEGKDKLIYKNGGYYNILSIAGDYSSQETIHLFPSSFDLPKYGEYVSDKFTQDKVDGEGKRIPTGEGGYEKEDFYLFLKISETKAELFVSDNPNSHDETPLHAINNYKRQYSTGGIIIKIPHADANYSVSLSRFTETTMHVTNSYEKHGDYSASGTFTIISND